MALAFISLMLPVFITFYMWCGLLAVLASADRPMRPLARLIMFLAWPYMVYIERTPKMRKFLEWANKA